jgi:phenylacetate-CoA ligase
VGDRLLRIYHHLPAPARSTAASLRGLYLRLWRYGPQTDRLVSEAIEREKWSPAEWTRWQQTRLAGVLRRAATEVPYYRRQWAERRRRGDRASWEYLENWPVLEKETLRKDPDAFVADDCNARYMFREHTAGTTGNALEVLVSRRVLLEYYALFEARFRHWNEVSRYDRWANIGGQLVTSVMQRRPPFWVWNPPLNQLYMSSYHLTPAFIPSYFDALGRRRIRYLWGYTSSLYALALEALRMGKRQRLKLRVAITNAEPLFDYQRRAITEAFECPVRETYGMAENVMAASECDRERLHAWPEVGFTEVLDRHSPVAPGKSGDLVCTGLLNTDMPLIRYRVGDRGVLPSFDSPCRCGRGLPVLTSLEGRTDDVLYAADGGRIGRLDPVFKENIPVREAQIVQESLMRIRVRYVPLEGFNRDAAELMIERLRARMGPVQVILEEVPSVPRTSGGKFRSVICALPEAERQEVCRLGREYQFPPARQGTWSYFN